MARKTRPKTTHEEWWLLTATTAPEDLDSWCALVRLDRERIRAAREALQEIADLNVAELRLHEAGVWFLPLSAAEDVVEDIWEQATVRLTAAQAAQVRGAAAAARRRTALHALRVALAQGRAVTPDGRVTPPCFPARPALVVGTCDPRDVERARALFPWTGEIEVERVTVADLTA